MRRLGLLFLLAVAASVFAGTPESFRVATYNLRNYIDMDRTLEGKFRRDYPKPESEKAVLRASILAVRPDVLAVQEVGSLAHLKELRDDLAAEGLRYDHVYVHEAEDDARRVGALWTSEIEARPRGHTDMPFRYFGRTLSPLRGMLELEIDRGNGRSLSVFVLHLKSRYTSDKRDHESRKRRIAEATAVRDRILQRFPAPQTDRFLVVGDLNDLRNSAAVRRLLSKGESELSQIVPCRDPDGLIWTYHYVRGGTYSLIDYILASPGTQASYSLSGGIHARPDYYTGSDHRLTWVDLAPRR